MERQVKKTIQEVKEFVSHNHSDLSFDWETTGLNYLTMEPVGISFYDGTRTTYIDLWKNPDQTQILNLLKVYFTLPGTYIAHNAKFDMKCCKKFLGFYPNDIFCTYIASFLLNENKSSHGLKELAQRELGVPETIINTWEVISQKGYNSPEFYQYAMYDAEWAWTLYQRYHSQLYSESLTYLFYKIEMPFLRVLAEMEINGVYVDKNRLSQLQSRTEQKLVELEDAMFHSVGDRVILQHRMFDEPMERVLPLNLKSSQQLAKYIKKKCGIQLTLKTEGGIDSVNKEVLLSLQGKHPFIDFLLDYRKLTKLYTSYIVPAWDLIESDGRLHGEYGIVHTGRTSCRNPNFQQLPNLNKKFSDLSYRSIFVAPTDHYLIGGDYKGQELRVLGEVSQDFVILNAFRKGQDLHLITANSIFNLELGPEALTEGTEENTKAIEKYKTERHRAKNGVNFPVIYGSSAFSISKNMNVPMEEASRWQREFFRIYPGVLPAINLTRKQLEQQGYVKTLMGRRRRFPDYHNLPKTAKGKQPSQARCVRQAFNFKIQGFSADQMKIAAAKTLDRGLKPVMLVHDELVIESNNLKDTEILKDCMENAVSLSIPFKVDCKTGKTYQDLK